MSLSINVNEYHFGEISQHVYKYMHIILYSCFDPEKIVNITNYSNCVVKLKFKNNMYIDRS